MRQLDLVSNQSIIPAEFQSMKGIEGPVKAHLAEENDFAAEVVIADQKFVSIEEIYRNFQSFGGGPNDYPTLEQVGSNFHRPILRTIMTTISEEILYTGWIEISQEFRGIGLNSIFQPHLANVARQAGFRFMTGAHTHEKIARHFLGTGRHLISEIQECYHWKFNPVIDYEGDKIGAEFYTIKFLYPEDAKKYLRRGRTNASIEDKVLYQKQLNSKNARRLTAYA